MPLNLKACPDCDRPVSPSAAVCPGCGRPLQPRAPGALTGRDAVLVLASLPAGLVLAFLVNYATGGAVAAVAVAFLGPVVWALWHASRRR